MLNLDAHIVIYILAGQLKPRELKIVNANDWLISDIVLWEVSMLNRLQSISLDVSSNAFKEFLQNVQVQPIDIKVCNALNRLDFKSNPADELIAATSLVHSAPLLTRDAVIRKSKIVPFA